MESIIDNVKAPKKVIPITIKIKQAIQLALITIDEATNYRFHSIIGPVVGRLW